jgi:nucleotide-binding universal stress UspA family protein
MPILNSTSKIQALQDFSRARRQAAFEEIVAYFTGRSVDLLSYEEVRQKFKLKNSSSRGLEEVPLEAIVGSVSRYQDFTRNFLPRQDIHAERWARVEVATLELSGLPPVDLYKLGNIYFVVDGNHRVSVARQLGATHIQAYVTEFQTKVPLEPGDQLEDIIIKAEYADFLEQTQLDQLQPEADLKVTTPGRYWELASQIEAIQHHMQSETAEQEVTYAEAVRYWYDQVYLPVVQLIRERGILRDFPGRTETDLYLWILRHQARLNQKLGWRIDPEAVALDLFQHHNSQLGRVVTWVEERLLEPFIPEGLEAGPEPGQWRREWLGARPDNRLFGHILTPLSGETSSWSALEQALSIAQREGGQIYGLTVVPPNRASDNALAVQQEFERRCGEAGVPCQFSVEAGPITRAIYERAVWADLVVMHLAHPPEADVFRKFGSGFRTILHRSPRPVLAVPGAVSSLKRALLAYDGSPKAQEALFVATYLAGQWQLPLVAATVVKQEQDEALLRSARLYLESRGVAATYVPTRSGEVASTLLKTARTYNCDLILMGGYGFKPVLDVVLGSAVDQVLRETEWPVLICR